MLLYSLIKEVFSSAITNKAMKVSSSIMNVHMHVMPLFFVHMILRLVTQVNIVTIFIFS